MVTAVSGFIEQVGSYDYDISFCHDLARFVLLATVLPLNWINSKIISGTTFHIIGLTKIPKIEFLPLDWIYLSIRIMRVFKLHKL